MKYKILAAYTFDHYIEFDSEKNVYKKRTIRNSFRHT